MFHIGHLNVLRAARQHCDRLVVGVAADESLYRMKGRMPIIPLRERCELVASLRFVDAVVVDLDQDKRLAWRLQPFDILFKGDDWKGTPKGDKLEAEMAEVGATVFYLPYTPSTSSTKLRRFIAPEDFTDEDVLAEGAVPSGVQVR
ncbi:MAG: cytidyltransferase [Propionibacteriaceae bacterium]|nr:cytidyltransferase [Propionibacteriaceae bacterium]